MNHIKLIPTFQRKKSIPKQLKDLELRPLNEQFSKLTTPIISDDDFRPNMMGNFFDMESKKIVSTDAHKLTAINMPKDTYNFIAQKYNKELNENPKGLIFHTLKQMQNDYNDLLKIGANESTGLQSFDEYVKFRAIEDGRYPNYEAVIPKEFTNEIYVDFTKLWWYSKVLLDAKIIDDATKINSSNENEYQNKKIEYLKDSYVPFLSSAKQIIFTYTLDGKKEYIGFDARYICDVLKFAMEYKGKTFGKVGLTGNSRAMLIELENGLYSPSDSIGLIMPVMIMNNDEYTIGQVDYDFNVKMYYDLDTNEINSDGVNYPIDSVIGYVPSKDSLINPIIRVEEKVSKIENNSMTFITNRIKGLKIALKVARAENKPKIQKRILGLEIAKKVQNNEKMNKGGVVFTNYNGSEIMYEPNYDEYFVNDEVFDSMESAKRHIDYMAKSNGVIIDYYNGYDINIYPKLNEYWVNDEIKFNSMEEAKNYIDTGEMENDSYGFGGGLLVGSLVGGYLGYKVGKYNKQVISSGFETEKVIGKDIKNKLQGKKTFNEGGGVDTISDEDLLRIKLAVAEAQDRINANQNESESGGSANDITNFIKENPQLLMLLEKGGSVGDENYEMLKNKVTELLHHSKELQEIVKKKPKTPAWVISKSSRASTDLSDITHYLEGKL